MSTPKSKQRLFMRRLFEAFLFYIQTVNNISARQEANLVLATPGGYVPERSPKTKSPEFIPPVRNGESFEEFLKSDDSQAYGIIRLAALVKTDIKSLTDGIADFAKKHSAEIGDEEGVLPAVYSQIDPADVFANYTTSDETTANQQQTPSTAPVPAPQMQPGRRLEDSIRKSAKDTFISSYPNRSYDDQFRPLEDALWRIMYREGFDLNLGSSGNVFEQLDQLVSMIKSGAPLLAQQNSIPLMNHQSLGF